MDAAQPAGWYPDDEGGTKYWDGKRWTGDVRRPRKPFAAASAHRGWAIGLILVGALVVVGSPTNLMSRTASVSGGGVAGFIVALLIGGAMVVFGIYLWRGQGPTTAQVVNKARAADQYDAALARFKAEAAKSLKPRAALVTPYLALLAASSQHFGAASAAQIREVLKDLGVDAGAMAPALIGQVPGLAVHPDWLVVDNKQAYDLTAATRAQFHLDDRVQTVTQSKTRGGKTISTSTEVPRGGTLQIVSEGWSQTVAVRPQYVPSARKLVEHLAIRVDQLREANRVAAEERRSVGAEQVRAIANPETAQALQNLQNLLYTRVISDEEFARMKAKLLGDTSVSN